MASAKTIARIEKLIWIYIYGGLFAIIVGVIIARGYRATGWWIGLTGALAVVAGVVLIFVRSRLQESPVAAANIDTPKTGNS